MRQAIKNNKFVRILHAAFLHCFGGNHFRGLRGNAVKIEGALRQVDVEIHGRGNAVTVLNPQYVNHFHVFINGSGNRIEIEENCLLRNLTLWIEDDGNSIHIGKDTIFCGNCQLSCIEGTRIEIGEKCMFSNDISVRTGDSHSVLDAGGQRINPSKNVKIGDHVWIGQGVTVLKGAEVAGNSICGTRAIITRKFDEPGVVLAGNPAKIVKANINWCYERI